MFEDLGMENKIIILEELTQAKKVWKWLAVILLILTVVYPTFLFFQSNGKETVLAISTTFYFLALSAFSWFMYYAATKYKLEITESTISLTTIRGKGTIPFSEIASFNYRAKAKTKEYVFCFVSKKQKTFSLTIQHHNEMLALLERLGIQQK